MRCECLPHQKQGWPYNEWYALYFGECIYYPNEYLSVTIAYLGLLATILSLFPQFYVNFKRKSASGLALNMLLCWTAGDLANLFGTIFTNQQKPQFVTALVFFFADFTLLGQYAWYQWIYPQFYTIRGLGLTEEEQVLLDNQDSEPDAWAEPFSTDPANDDETGNNHISPHTSSVSSLATRKAMLLSALIPTATALISPAIAIAALPLCDAPVPLTGAMEILGFGCAWASGLFYFSSRIPQVLKNWRTKTVEGLSFHLFAMTIIGNLGYGVSVVLRVPTVDARFYLATLPYLIGSLGVLVFDLFTLLQFKWYFVETVRLDDDA